MEVGAVWHPSSEAFRLNGAGSELPLLKKRAQTWALPSPPGASQLWLAQAEAATHPSPQS